MNLTRQNTHVKLYQDCSKKYYRASIMVRKTGEPFFFIDTSSLAYDQIMSILGSLIDGFFDEETKKFWDDHVTKTFSNLEKDHED